MSKLLKNIKLTVMHTTAADLKYLAETSKLSEGEVVDRLTAKISSTDPEIAEKLTLEDIMILTAKLGREDKANVLYNIASILMAFFPSEIMDQIMEDAKEMRKETQEEFSTMTQEEKDQKKKEVEEALYSNLIQRGPGVSDEN